MRHLILVCILGVWAAPAAAQGAALLLGSSRYEALDRVPRGAAPLTAMTKLEAQGYQVRGLRDPEAAEANDALNTLAQRLDRFDAVIVTLSGQFATDGALTWYFTTDAKGPRLFGMGESAIPIQSVLQVLARRPGASLLLLGTQTESDLTYFGDWLEGGIGAIDVPQGVTALAGSPSDIAEFLTDQVANPGTDIVAALRRNSDIRSLGPLPNRLVLTSGGASEVDRRAEAELWAQTRRRDTLGAYADYLERYPLGRFADEAEERIEALLSEPYRGERLGEEALQLTRDKRREIQRDLTVLGYNTRGVDGIFGAGTRQAISNWQRQNGLDPSSYLTAVQIERLGRQAEQRRAEQREAQERERQTAERRDRAYWQETGILGTEQGYRSYLDRYPQGLFAETARRGLDRIAEERRQAADVERRERAYWQETGALGTERGYRAYLDRYPRGLFAETARRGLDRIEADRRQADRDDRAAWDRAQASDQISAYRRYLEAFPNGRFRAQAQERIAALRDRPLPPLTDAERAEAREEEESLDLNPITTRLIEARLRDLGLEPGPVDGKFDEATRRAILAYQRDQNLPATGYLNQQTASELLAGTIYNLFQ